MYRISCVTYVSITEISVFKVQIIFDGLQIDSLKVIRQKEYIQIDDKVGMLMKYTIDKYIIRVLYDRLLQNRKNDFDIPEREIFLRAGKIQSNVTLRSNCEM